MSQQPKLIYQVCHHFYVCVMSKHLTTQISNWNESDVHASFQFTLKAKTYVFINKMDIFCGTRNQIDTDIN